MHSVAPWRIYFRHQRIHFARLPIVSSLLFNLTKLAGRVHISDELTNSTAFKMDSELYNFASIGNLKRVKELVEGGANIEETDNAGRTALSLASLHGNFAIVVYLVEHGANFAHTDNGGRTALR
jgi:hypothetical protein